MNTEQILAAISTALGVLKAVASMPGVSIIPYASTIAVAVDAIAEAIEFGNEKVRPYVEALLDTFGEDGHVPTLEEVAALETRIGELRQQLHAPLPPREEGEPE